MNKFFFKAIVIGALMVPPLMAAPEEKIPPESPTKEQNTGESKKPSADEATTSATKLKNAATKSEKKSKTLPNSAAAKKATAILNATIGKGIQTNPMTAKINAGPDTKITNQQAIDSAINRLNGVSQMEGKNPSWLAQLNGQADITGEGSKGSQIEQDILLLTSAGPLGDGPLTCVGKDGTITVGENLGSSLVLKDDDGNEVIEKRKEGIEIKHYKKPSSLKDENGNNITTIGTVVVKAMKNGYCLIHVSA